MYILTAQGVIQEGGTVPPSVGSVADQGESPQNNYNV